MLEQRTPREVRPITNKIKRHLKRYGIGNSVSFEPIGQIFCVYPHEEITVYCKGVILDIVQAGASGCGLYVDNGLVKKSKENGN